MKVNVRRQVMLGLFLVMLGFSMVAFPATGAAFVHGKGDGSLAGASVAWDYWTTDMLRASTNNWAVPYKVCHYDGRDYMWIAADTVAGQLYDFITQNNITDLVINTHSFGGVVIRWIFSNPTWDSRYPTIINATRWVNTIAGPHKGSEAADLAGTLSGSWLTSWLVSLLNQDYDSTFNCQTSWMDYYNTNWLYGTSGRPALPKSFYTISGWGLWNDWCTECIGLATLSGIAGLPGEDDGMVAEYSAESIGSLWFRTKANHHYNRRNSYRQIGDSLGTDFQ
jgi:hypothetical protein